MQSISQTDLFPLLPSYFNCFHEVFLILFQLHRAHLNAVAMMNVDVDIEDAFVVLQQLQDANDNVVDEAEAACLRPLGYNVQI